MQRIATTTRSVDLHGTGKDGFRDEAPGEAPTVVNSAFMNAVQEELANAVEKTGMALNTSTTAEVAKHQLIDALALMFVDKAFRSYDTIAAATGITNNPQRIAHDGGAHFIAVGDDGEIQTSNNAGGNWTKRTPGSSFSGFFNGCCYASTLALAVAVGVAGEIQTSADLSTWTRREGASSLTAQSFTSVTWSSALGMLVAVGSGGVIYTSTDGTSWTARTSGTSNSISDVAWIASLSKFVAFTGSCEALTSSDGITWAISSSLAAYTPYQIAWNGRVVAVSLSNGSVLTSPDGVTWTSRATGGASAYSIIAIGAVLACSTANTNTTVLISADDGLTWSEISLPLYGTGALSRQLCVAQSGIDKGLIVMSFNTGSPVFTTTSVPSMLAV